MERLCDRNVKVPRQTSSVERHNSTWAQPNTENEQGDTGTRGGEQRFSSDVAKYQWSSKSGVDHLAEETCWIQRKEQPEPRTVNCISKISQINHICFLLPILFRLPPFEQLVP